MSVAQAGLRHDDVNTLVQLCGYSPDHAHAELTAFSHREKAGLIPVSHALEVLARTARVAEDPADAVINRRRWREILRGSGDGFHELAA